MAIQPARRSRGRAVNVEQTEDARPQFEIDCEEAYRQNKIKNAATSAEKKAKTNAEAGMLQSNVARYEFLDGNKTIECVIEGDEKNEADVIKLWGLYKAGEITEAQLLEVIGTSQGAIKDKLGSNVLSRCLSPKIIPARLCIREKKA